MINGEVRVAYHEAGHAVAALVERRAIVVVTIDGEPGVYRGRLEVTDLAPSQTARRACEMVIALAGTAAEHREFGAHDRLESEADFAAARDLASELASRAQHAGDEAYVRCQLERALTRAKAIIEEHHVDVALLAAELLRRRTMTGRAVRSFWRSLQS